MHRVVLTQFLALSLYALYMGFSFCDGFGLPTKRKLIWFITFLFIAAFVFYTEGQYDLALILPVPSLLAILLCSIQKRKRIAK